jgi:hypothetical protein
MRTSIALVVLLMAGPAVAQPTVPRSQPPETSRASARLTADDLNRLVLLLLRGEASGITGEGRSTALANIRRRMGLT